MGSNNSKQNFFDIVNKRDKLRQTSSSIKHGDKLYYNENELFLGINKPIDVFDTKIFSKNTQIDYAVDYKIPFRPKNFHIIFLNRLLSKYIFNTNAFSNS